MENNKKEEDILERPLKKLYITKNEEKIQIKRTIKMESDSNRSETSDGFKGKIYQKKKLNIRKEKIDDDTNQINMGGENKYVNIFKDRMIKKYDINKNEENEDEYYKYKNNNNDLIRNQSTLINNLSEAFKLDGRPTKIKIYKCVIWKNLNPNVEDIKNIIHRSSSQIFNSGKYVVKPKNKTYKAKSGFA